MSEKTLFIEIFQPFAQYRNPFTFYYAQTYPLPPKSTIIGMLQNAVGDWYGNEFGIENWWNLKVSVHGRFESVFWNYQNLIKGETYLQQKNGKLALVNQNLPLYGEGLTSQRTPVYQQELFNGHLFIFIKGEETLLSEIKTAIEQPKKVLFLGRSEDVVFIRNIKPIGVEKRVEQITDVKLKHPTYIKAEGIQLKKRNYPVYSIPVEVKFLNNSTPVKRKFEITKKTERKTKFETVIFTESDCSLIFKDSAVRQGLDIYNIGDKEFRIVDGGWL
jgi:CRISPR-associated protein Cas5t